MVIHTSAPETMDSWAGCELLDEADAQTLEPVQVLRLLLANREKIAFGVWGSGGSLVDDNLKNGRELKLRAYIQNNDFPKNRQDFILMLFHGW